MHIMNKKFKKKHQKRMQWQNTPWSMLRVRMDEELNKMIEHEYGNL